MKIQKFEDLNIWNDSVAIAKEIYLITNEGKFGKDFGLRDQIRRAIVSVSSNIVEGFEKNNNNEFVRYLRIAKGSAGEVRSQLYIVLEIEYISRNNFEKMSEKLKKLSAQTGSFISYLEKNKNSPARETR
ncbi:MAG: four helix bundle protein [bacterium]|nr:four helix bundle protein [bacterium]